MKDYPDAQDILQSLGRRRLMEVRGVNKKPVRPAPEKESIASNVLTHAKVVNNSENSTSEPNCR